MPKTAHIKALDGVRGLAILAVVLAHSSSIVKDLPPAVAGVLGLGTFGVNLFFALSGFLITSILLRERGAPKYFRNFYVRRALRIWPLYYLYLAAMYAMVRGIPHLAAYRHLVAHSAYLQTSPLVITTPFVISLVFAQNLWWPSLFCFGDLTSITWSLCIEEQFYLFWPVAVRFLRRKAFLALPVLLLIASPLLRMLVYAHVQNSVYQWQTVYRFPIFHFDSIAAGSLLAIVWPRLEVWKWTRTIAGAALAVSILWLALAGPKSVWAFSAAALFSTALIGLALLRTGERVWRWKPLTFLGLISYGLYLIHPTIFDLLQSRTLYRMVGLHGSLLLIEPCVAAFAIGVSVLLATLSRYTLEAFFLGIKDRKSRGEGKLLLTLQPPEKA